ncbi:MAG: superoxide dismutase [Phycisphaeraceae bacterium]|nr:superoxide dismutase [Phycisphaeraceae bacterium]
MMAFELPALPYAINALEPHIDARTMEIHHDKHHAGYVANANKALEGTALADLTCPWTASGRLQELPKEKQNAARNNVGGHANHSLFWSIMGGEGMGKAPAGELADAIKSSFGSFESFQEAFTTAATTRFGSGWAWLGVCGESKLAVCSTANQDNPVMKPLIGDAAGCGCRPILGLDVWEHAYYLNYQNRRPDYVKAWWSVVNWSKVAEYFGKACQCKSAACC